MILFCTVMMVGLFAWADENNLDPVDVKSYDNARVIRVKHSEGETFVKRSYDEGYEEASPNLPVFEKDIVGTTDGRVELYLGSLNYLRLDNDTEVEFDKVPALRKTDMALRLNKGGIYLDVTNLDHEKDIELQTPDCGLFLLEPGKYRIDVNEDGNTEVLIEEGKAEVTGEDYSRVLGADQKIVMSEGRVTERPDYAQASDSDNFENWNEGRNEDLGNARYTSSHYLDDGYEDCEYELSRQGRWRYSTSYNTYMWIPYHVDGGWSPYYNGQWIWHPIYGYVWHSYDSWGWYTHHYGRWHWSYYDGWCWLPGYRWSPAWVSWYGHDNYHGWCPIDYRNRPIIVVNKSWLKNYDIRRGMPTHSSSLIVVKKSQLSAAHISKVALRNSELNHISQKGVVFKGRAPDEKPVVGKVRLTNARGKSVIYKENGVSSTDRYRKSKSYTVTSRGQNTDKKVFSSSTTIKKTNKDRYDGGNSGTRVYRKYSSSSSGRSTTSSGDTGSRTVSKKSSYKSSSSSSSSSSSGSSSATKKIKKKDGVSQPYFGSHSTSRPVYRSSSSLSTANYSSSAPVSRGYYSSSSTTSSSYSSPKVVSKSRSYSSDNFGTSNSSYTGSPSVKSSYKSSASSVGSSIRSSSPSRPVAVRSSSSSGSSSSGTVVKKKK
jgi:hypothetical protein